MLIVAMLSYLFSLQIKAEPRRCVNNYFTGLFHDLPEVLTRDIINPIKRSVRGLKDLIKDYERQEMERKIYKLIPEEWHDEMRMYTENEFKDIVARDSSLQRDGELIKAIDELAAFIEVHLSLENGIQNDALKEAKHSLKERYGSRTVSGVSFSKIYKDFD